MNSKKCGCSYIEGMDERGKFIDQVICDKHSPSPHNEWEKEFQRLFVDMPERLKGDKMAEIFHPTIVKYAEEVKSFISQTLLSQQERIREWAEKGHTRSSNTARFGSKEIAEKAFSRLEVYEDLLAFLNTMK